MAYATSADLETLTGTPIDLSRSELLLDLASDLIDTYLGGPQLDAAATELYDRPDGELLVLRRWPVTSVTSVTVADIHGDETTLDADRYRWTRTGILTRTGGCWPDRTQSVEVTYTAGHEEDSPTAGTLKSVCLDMARSAAVNPSGVQSESIGDWSATYEGVVVGISPTHQQALDRLRTPTVS